MGKVFFFFESTKLILERRACPSLCEGMRNILYGTRERGLLLLGDWYLQPGRELSFVVSEKTHAFLPPLPHPSECH